MVLVQLLVTAATVITVISAFAQKATMSLDFIGTVNVSTKKSCLVGVCVSLSRVRQKLLRKSYEERKGSSLMAFVQDWLNVC